MLFARRATEDDTETLINLGRYANAECFPHLEYDEGRARQLIEDALVQPPNRFFVAEENGKLIGFSLCEYSPMPWTTGFYTNQHVVYVRPDKRRTRAAAELVQAYCAWIERLRPKEALITLGSGRRAEASARLIRRHGFEVVGHVLRMTGMHPNEHRQR